jgi:radical SAM protein with 4Fe4S-binding SPASM domain
MGRRPGWPWRRIIWPPSLPLRQLEAAVRFARLTHWRGFWRWLARHALPSLPVSAGSIGMGCIGYPAHPAWEVTNACNLRCIHCHASSGKPGEDEMTTEEAKRFIDQLASVDEFRMLVYTGGEPLVRPDIFELMEHSRRAGLVNVLATNATLITEEVAHRLREVGVAGVAVSLDSCDADVHNAIRRSPEAFKSALEGMRNVRKAGMLLQVNTTAMEYNFDTLRDLIELADERGSSIMLMYQLVPVGRGGTIGAATLDIAMNEKLLRYLAEQQQHISTIVEPVAGPQYWPFLMEREGKTGARWMKAASRVFHGCAAGRGFVYIKPNGDIWSCPFVEVSAGNVRETDFATIWREGEVFQVLRERETRLQGKCGDCRYNGICGGCRGRAMAVTGELMAADPSCFIPEERTKRPIVA